MMNSSSQSKALAASFAALVATAALIIWSAVRDPEPTALALLTLVASATALSIYYARRLGRVLQTAADVADRVSKGDMEARLIDLGESGLINSFAVSVNRAFNISDAFLREATAAMEHARENKFYRKLVVRGMPGSYRQGADAINAATSAMATRLEDNRRMASDFESKLKGVIDAVAAAATELQATAESLNRTAQESSRRATAVGAASEQATANVQAVAAAAEELSKSVKEISQQVERSTSIAGNAVDEARRTDSGVQALSEAAQKIGEVVKLINDIASQTNLLALNATIEAARAGEAGKGFAVVASEVKSLASQTAKATEDISSQVGAIQGATRDAVEAIRKIGATIGKISEASTSIASAVEEQGAATGEIARNVQQTAAGTHEVTVNIGAVSEAAGETDLATTQVLAAAKELAGQAETLRREVAEFFVKARAA